MTYKKKLIEVALPLATINAESAREKSIRHGHPSTLHLWWARRPLAAARAVLWASLVDDPSAHPDRFPTEEDQLAERRRLFDILERLVPWEASNDQRVLAEARAEIERSCDGDLPKVLDPFGGGGAIPLEAIRLGLPTFSGDLNPVAVLIQRAMLELPSRFAGRAPIHPDVRGSQGVWEGARGLAADVAAYGAWVGEEAHKLIGQHFPDALLPDGSFGTPIAWIWARTVRSPDPSWPGQVPLVKSWVLSKRPGRPLVWIEPEVDPSDMTITFRIRHGGEPIDGTVKKSGAICLATGAPIPFSHIRSEAVAGRLGEQMIAVVAEAPRGRVYCEVTDRDRQAADVALDWRPEGRLPKAGLGFRVQNYGMTEWSSFFSARQTKALQTFSELVDQARTHILSDATAVGFENDPRRFRDGGQGAVAYADAVATYLAFVLDRVAPRWCTLTAWHNTGEKIEQVFRRQAISMNWDYPEANPFSNSTGSWSGQIEWVTKCVELLPTGNAGHVAQRDAAAHVREVGRALISTDPPYYDNVGYADLADFFYVWLRRSVREIWPDDVATLLTPKTEELIADAGRAGSKAAAIAHFESGMRNVFTEVAATQDPRFPATIYYAFKAAETKEGGVVSTGWETFLRGVLDAGLTVTATWPIRTEMTGGLRHVGRSSLASSVILACRRREVTAPMATRSEFVGSLRRELDPAVRLLQAGNIAPVDLAQSAIGPGIAIFSRYSKVVEADGSAMSVRTALGLINDALAEVLSGEESEFDPDTRFALTWFEQYGQNPGPYGDADTLARAKDTSVEGIVRSGIASNRDSRLRLVERDELREGWDPATDERLTVWETAQYLIRAVDSSESEAAMLLSRMGFGHGERARQLAYLLYGICERKKWAEEAGSYNMLVTAWPELVRLAAAGPVTQMDDERLF